MEEKKAVLDASDATFSELSFGKIRAVAWPGVARVFVDDPLTGEAVGFDFLLALEFPEFAATCFSLAAVWGWKHVFEIDTEAFE